MRVEGRTEADHAVDARGRPVPRAVLIALPALVIAGLGCVHPGHLTAETAQWWSTLHVILLPVFPLLAAAQWRALDGAPVALRWPGRLAAFGFGVYYDGLDALAGIAAGAIVHEEGRGPAALAVLEIGDRLGLVGAWCFLIANGVIVVAALVARAGWAVVPGGAVLLTASVSFLDSHLFWPRGVLTLLGVAVGLVLLDRRGAAWAATPGGPAPDSKTGGSPTRGPADERI